MKIPQLLLRQLYTFGSLTNEPGGFRFSLKNRLSDVTLTRIVRVKFDHQEFPASMLEVDLGDGQWRPATEVTPEQPREFALRQVAHLRARGHTLPDGTHEIEIGIEVKGVGALAFTVKDHVAEPQARLRSVPYSKDDNYSPAVIAERQRFIEKVSGARLQHLTKFSFDPQVTKGNIENFTGVAQIPLGFAGPLQVNGEHAQGEFIIPMATSEGTLVASYNRGMKVLNLSGGVTCTVQGDHMQRAPVFVFDSAREARAFRDWVDEHMAEVRREAEATTRVGKLQYIDTYLASKFAYLRFNYSTGDAAGQNMVGRATFAACSWILDHNKTIRRFYLESNLATDKKASQVNLMRTRGKRVTAECVIKRSVLLDVMRVEPESLCYHWGVANVGAILSGANNNGLHSPNAITAMFIATGQDVANVAEGSAGIVYVELTKEKDLYLSITIPSLIVATHGGGTGLPTQRECLEILGCVGKGKVNKFAEIVAGVVLAGEISLAAAISSLEWVSSHEEYGRNR
ncbi:MAG: hydroxymethylglutaryl-CoA reductase [Gemmatimonadetes bacterium]|nr:hydroxymethylglutaryl-CoA reductase [Gemmatimonadota bacterium]MBK6781555.1 hydroxymethylglutaryl-CoA reductase [Gemmatimonadota bacterium]MBK7715596.1 hydroxymethylglutaryl-CoA reductase [Gemmatimonadota bacterium]MBK7925567.1 hydroxymethylglutaryl-CoA reductase [Gemmatimonadota bacterium]